MVAHDPFRQVRRQLERVALAGIVFEGDGCVDGGFEQGRLPGWD